ncbi:MAG: helix-turn-helix domain-containing protein [Candidatus Omnitrophota bacterium]
METIEIMQEAYRKLVDKMDSIDKKLDDRKNATTLSENWLDIQEACQVLKISKRTLQSYRDNGILPFSQIGGKIYFRANDIEEHLNRHYNKAFNKR